MAKPTNSQNTDSRKQKSDSTNRSNRSRTRNRNKYKNEKREASDSIPESGGPNSPDWYAKNAQIMIDAASLPYSNHLGTVSTLGEVTKFTSPGLFATYYSPTVGYSTDGTSAINIAANNFYSWIRHANSGHANYDAPDLMLYLLAMDSIHSFHYFMARVYGIMRAYSYFNRYYPRTIIESMSIDFDDLQEQLADFRYYINQYAIKAASFAIPAGMTYMERHKWMYSGLYLDSMSVRAQTYCMNPFSFLQYVETEGAGKLEYLKWDNQHLPKGSRHLRTLEQIKGYGDALLSAVQMSEDCNIMSGDILKAYSADKITKSFQLPEDYLVTPQFNPEVLSQIQNTTVLPTEGLLEGTLGVEQSPTGILLQSVRYKSTHDSDAIFKLYDTSRILAMYKDVVTPADNIVATRCMVIPTYNENGSLPATMAITACGSDICVFSQISPVPVETSKASGFEALTRAPSYIQPYDSASSADTTMSMCANYSRFNNHPATWVTKSNSESTMISSGSVFFDVDNYTIVNKNDLQKMHETALLSQFSAPLVTFMM